MIYTLLTTAMQQAGKQHLREAQHLLHQGKYDAAQLLLRAACLNLASTRDTVTLQRAQHTLTALQARNQDYCVVDTSPASADESCSASNTGPVAHLH